MEIVWKWSITYYCNNEFPMVGWAEAASLAPHRGNCWTTALHCVVRRSRIVCVCVCEGDWVWFVFTHCTTVNQTPSIPSRPPPCKYRPALHRGSGRSHDAASLRITKCPCVQKGTHLKHPPATQRSFLRPRWPRPWSTRHSRLHVSNVDTKLI